MMSLGAKVEDRDYPHHNANFYIDESFLKTGAEYFISYTKEYFES